MERLAAITMCLLVAGCNKDSTLQQHEQLKKEVAALKNIVNTQSQQIDLLKSKLEIAESGDSATKLVIREILLRDNSVAVLDIGSSGYRPISHSSGSMVVSLEDVSAYASGSKVKLRFGNLAFANFSGVSAKIEYGPLNADGSIDESLIKSKTEAFTPKFPPGSWVWVTLILDKIKPDEIGFIRISELSHTNMSLSSTTN